MFFFSTVRVLSLTGSHSPPHLPRMSSNAVLVSGPAVRAAQILIQAYSCLYLLWRLPELGVFLLCEYSLYFYIFHKHSVYLVDCVDLICSLHS